jgi:hypothetical protein
MAERAASRGLVSGVKRSDQDPRMAKEVCSALLLTEAFGEKRQAGSAATDDRPAATGLWADARLRRGSHGREVTAIRA